jgi:hypothetical protein
LKYVKVAGIACGLIYFLIGTAFSFTLGNEDFWSGVAVYLALFLLPLPIVLAAVWFPRHAGKALIACAAVSVTVSMANIVSSGNAPNLAGLLKFMMYHVPHLVFGVAYIRTGAAIRTQGMRPKDFHDR